MYKVRQYPHGTFSWAGVMTSDAERSIAFYTALFGWTTTDLELAPGMTLTMFQLEGEPVAALNRMTPELIAQGFPVQWSNEVTVSDVNALAEVVTAKGGAIVFGPMAMFDHGSMLCIQDPRRGGAESLAGGARRSAPVSSIGRAP